MTKKPNPSADLRGFASLSVDAVRGITDLVEELHQTINCLGGILANPQQGRTKGITGMVYQSIRAVTSLVGSGIDASLAKQTLIFEEIESTPRREALLAILNGVFGDHLVVRNNSLAIPMSFRCDGRAVGKQAIGDAIHQANGRLLLLVHGSCMNDLQWNRQGHDHGVALARDLGLARLYVHYNSGLHISENGKELSYRLEKLIGQSTEKITLSIVAHSMGGLVARSAFSYGRLAGHTWLNSLKKVVFLGTPHHGALLEKGGNWITHILKISPYSAPFANLGMIRSAGVTDLRYGNIVEEDWIGRDRFQHCGDHRVPNPLLKDVDCYAIAATTTKASSKLGDNLIGDGLVTVDSALGRHKNPDFNLAFPIDHQWVGRDINHLDLLTRPEVYETIKNWLKN